MVVPCLAGRAEGTVGNGRTTGAASQTTVSGKDGRGAGVWGCGGVGVETDTLTSYDFSGRLYLGKTRTAVTTLCGGGLCMPMARRAPVTGSLVASSQTTRARKNQLYHLPVLSDGCSFSSSRTRFALSNNTNTSAYSEWVQQQRLL